MSPNPYDNPGYFGEVLVGNRPVPGTIIDITGLETTDEWVVTKGFASTGASMSWRGRTPIKGIRVKTSLNARTEDQRRDAWDAHYGFIKYLKPGKRIKPPSFEVTNTSFKGAFVQKIVYAGHIEPIFRVGPPIIVEYIFDEFDKSRRILPAPPEDAIINDSDPKPQDVKEADFVAAQAQAREGP